MFQARGVGEGSEIVLRRQLRISELLKFFEALPQCLVGTGARAQRALRYSAADAGALRQAMGDEKSRPVRGSPGYPLGGVPGATKNPQNSEYPARLHTRGSRIATPSLSAVRARPGPGLCPQDPSEWRRYQ